ncbi:hypothetical protein BKA62DRAFT_692259 [Auriculariales sp. MPI-PUGE-AT-0066]|nr:hypothetical protein BKA62DRAFT_692259 [Auriculariales sp. MPI-PUGE-AT-0066]
MPPLEADADAVWFTATDVKDPLHIYEKDCLLLANNSRRFVLFPIQHRDIWDLYKDIEHSFWTAEDFELDVVEGLDTHVLGPQLQVAQTLRASGVAELLAAELQAPEARCFWGFKGCCMLENIHVETLSIALLKSGGDFMISDAHTLETLLVNCADAERNVFTRRLIVYATVLSYYAASLDAAARLWETSPIRYIQRDASRFANFAALLCRSIIAEPGPDVEQLVHNVVAFCARALITHLDQQKDGAHSQITPSVLCVDRLSSPIVL